MENKKTIMENEKEMSVIVGSSENNQYLGYKKFFDFEYKQGYYKINVHNDYIYSIPEFAKLKSLHQSPKWHSESEYVSGHVDKVIQECVKYIESGKDTFNEFEVIVLVLASIFHDIGKSSTTFFKESDGLYHHYNHEIEGEKMTRRILWDLGCEIREPVCQLVRWHMHPFNILKHKHFNKVVDDIIRLSYNVPSIRLLCVLKRFDCVGSVSQDPELDKNDIHKINTIENIARDLNCYFGQSMAKTTFNLFNYINSEKKKLNVFLYMGLPGAGKDYNIKNRNFLQDAPIICRDDIRIELGYCGKDEKYLGTKEEEDLVTKIFNQKLIEAANNSDAIIINNMNNKRKYRDAYKEILKDFNVKWCYVYVEADSLQKNIDRRNGQIPEYSFYKMAETFEFPSSDEYDFLEIHKS